MKIRFGVCFVVIFFVLIIIFNATKIIDIFRQGIFTQQKEEKITFRDIFKWFNFSEKRVLDEWENKIFKGKTVYVINQKDSEKFLYSKSQKTASALYHLVSYNIKDYPILNWKWRPIKFPNKEGITDPKLKDDYALRLYLIFASGFFSNFRCVEYVWDESLKEGTKLVSPYSDNIMQFVIRSGFGSEEWVMEERNVLEDYINLFGREPKQKVQAIAIMSDSEGTQDSSEANFKEIKIVKKL